MIQDKLYIITRNDISPGYQAAQAIHGAIEFVLTYPELTKNWHDISNYIVVLGLNNKYELFNLYNKAINKDIKCVKFIEPDLNDEITSIVLEPGINSKRLCSNIKLLGKQYQRLQLNGLAVISNVMTCGFESHQARMASQLNIRADTSNVL